MSEWVNPLTKSEIKTLLDVNKDNGPCEVVENGPIGPMVICDATKKGYSVFYCGGDGSSWKTSEEFREDYPQWPLVMSEPEMELDEIHQAEELMESMK